MLGKFLHWINLRGRSHSESFWRVVLFWSPAVCLVFTAVFAGFGDFETFVVSLAISLIISTTSVATCIGASAGFDRTRKALRGRRGLDKQNLTSGQAWLAAVAALPVGVYLGFTIARAVFDFSPPGLRSLGYGVVLGLVAMLVSFLNEVLGDLDDAKRLAQLRGQQIENERLKGEVAALTAQMNPHILFNTLNTIASLTHTDPEAAEATTLQLAELYRGVLAATRRETHALADELAICRSYLAIEHARFGDRIRFNLKVADIDPDQIQVPPLLLQPLVENSVKHGLAPLESGGTVTISAGEVGDHIVLVVEDDGAGVHSNGSARSSHNGTALENLRTRLSLLFGDGAHLELTSRTSGGTRVEVSLPREPPTARGALP